MQINRKHIHIILFVALLSMASCSVTKNTPTRYKTMTQRVQLTLTLDQHQFNMASTMRMWRNQLIVLSVQPMLGIEMVRIEATPDSVWVFDKMNRRYTALDYAGANQILQPNISYKQLQDWVNSPIAPDKKASVHQSYQSGKHTLDITCKFSNREYNTLQEPQQTNTPKYKRVTLRGILPLWEKSSSTYSAVCWHCQW